MLPERLGCPTGKVCIATRQQAQHVLNAHKAKGDRLRAAYRCPICATWHLTHARRKHRRRYRYNRPHEHDE